jgi:protein TonB
VNARQDRGMNERCMESFAARGEDGFRIRAAALWGAAGLFVFGSHVACALVFLDWRPLAVIAAEPPAAIMIDLPPNAPALEARPRVHRPPGQAADTELVSVTDLAQTATVASAVQAGQADDARQFGSPAPRPGLAAPLAARRAPVATARHPKPKKTARKTARARHRAAAAPLPIVTPRQRLHGGEDAPAARLAASAVGSSASPAAVPSTWKSSLLARLERYKRYPEAARAGREEGTTLLSFTIDRDGRVLDSFIARSSGFARLDDETLAMIARAQPLPKIPPEVPGETLQLVVPIHFSID